MTPPRIDVSMEPSAVTPPSIDTSMEMSAVAPRSIDISMEPSAVTLPRIGGPKRRGDAAPFAPDF